MTATTANGRGWASFHGGHTIFGDGRDTVSEMAQAAADRGFQAFGFTEHFITPPIRQFNPDGRVNKLELRNADWLPPYFEAVRAAQVRHASQLQIVLGTELEFIRGAEAWTRDQIARWPFEYFVGSVHFVRYEGDDICIDWDRPRAAEALRRAGSPEQLFLDYYDHVLELLDWRIAHVIGHIDLIKILLEPAEQLDTPAIRSKVRGILETMHDRGVAMDINARGLIKPIRAIYPADWILAEAHRIGVKVTLGDDSHNVGDVGARLDHAVAALRRAGYSKMALVRPGGLTELVPLPGE